MARYPVATRLPLAIAALHLSFAPTRAAEITLRQVTQAVIKAKRGAPVDFSGKNLSLLDLSGLDFQSARMAGADLFGVDLTGCDLSDADLSGAKLDRAVLVRANFSRANLSGATLFRPNVFLDPSLAWTNGPRFTGANLSNMRVMARLDGSKFDGANLTGADFSPLEPRPGARAQSNNRANECRGCDFSEADLTNSNLAEVILPFARFVNANLENVDLSDADLSRADFSGANLAGVKLARANLDGADFRGAKGLDRVEGLATARHRDRAKW